MQIDHVALWTHQLEAVRAFYVAYFGAASGEKYRNPTTGFESYFLTFLCGTRLEIMQMPGIPQRPDPDTPITGWAHLAFATGSTAEVDALTARLRAAGYRIVSEPRITGDGYYESVVLDPDGNRAEITV